ncbi:sigma-70 family RNA polymerase sigma factor [Novosphingobium sp. RL4]|uniref:sigma-70 family RNA polymerase sigma factor n=1 Tax=Novosphingobium sp. RL4 TaxID=3109595 RepID=UPI002D78B7A4|nr:sigma-70 family RNA polymerase sigma factor [Novosphingobium sp. RL4]WRT95780.1 sigma-70 family RNA polymerase sigma factor [Novosphingobium sp. RL4]
MISSRRTGRIAASEKLAVRNGSSAKPTEERARLVAALHLAAASEPSGLRAVYEMTAPKLFGICLRICGDRGAAEDVLQDVYVKVWRRAGAFDAERASPISWLAAIAHNSAIDWRRSQHRHVAVSEEILAAIPDEAPLADAVFADEQENRRLLGCLEGLDSHQSNAIQRAFLDGLTYQQLADQLQTPLGTIKSWIRRGMQRLKDCLSDG